MSKTTVSPELLCDGNAIKSVINDAVERTEFEIEKGYTSLALNSLSFIVTLLNITLLKYEKTEKERNDFNNQLKVLKVKLDLYRDTIDAITNSTTTDVTKIRKVLTDLKEEENK